MISLLRPVVHNRTTYLEQVLGDILGCPCEAARLSVDIQALPVLIDHSIELDGLPHQAIFAYEMQLVQHVNQIHLIRLLDLVLNDEAEFIVKLLY